jgi:hypothetical protein
MQIDIRRLEEPFRRADIEFHKVDSSALSYEGRVFLNNPNADQYTPLSLERGYVGSYHIFAYGGFLNDEGQFDIHEEKSKYERLSDSLACHKRIIVTEALKKMGYHTNEFVITIVPVLPAGSSRTDGLDANDIVKLEKIEIINRDSCEDLLGSLDTGSYFTSNFQSMFLNVYKTYHYKNFLWFLGLGRRKRLNANT